VRRNKLYKINAKAKVTLMDFYHSGLKQEKIKRDEIVKVKQNIEDRFAKV